MSDMKRLAAATALAQQVQLADLTASTDWAQIPDDVAEWMGMRPYVAQEQQAAS